ncbi:YfmQ family protein [Sporosarcina koreensis]|uniref:YfmQ family protein n=1 Tax=Bacillales TaxID=1385 RepID=UPI00075A4A78|nr:YfmQ family protein [Sporosarcina koreensis]
MIWTIIATIIGVILIFISSPTSALVGWILNKFALHPKLDPKDITVTFNGMRLEEEEKNRFSTYFNEAQYVKRNHIFPGTEKSFLHPETAVIPFVINVKNRKKEMNFFLYHNDDHVDVVKQWKKKVASFSLSSEPLQNFSISEKA